MAHENLQLKTKTVKGFFWKFAERMSAQLVSLVVSIILARLLTPDDYSVVGIVGILSKIKFKLRFARFIGSGKR